MDPAGNKFTVAMPTYRMSQEDMANLIAYLKRIETDTDPGLTENSIVIGTVLPDKAALNGLAQSMGDVLQAYLPRLTVAAASTIARSNCASCTAIRKQQLQT